MNPLYQKSFNPRAPCGARQPAFAPSADTFMFQSTRPVWGATKGTVNYMIIGVFQSTRPVWGATNVARLDALTIAFQSTRPVWGATICR